MLVNDTVKDNLNIRLSKNFVHSATCSSFFSSHFLLDEERSSMQKPRSATVTTIRGKGRHISVQEIGRLCLSCHRNWPLMVHRPPTTKEMYLGEEIGQH